MTKKHSVLVYPRSGPPFTARIKARSSIEALCVAMGMFKDALELRAVAERRTSPVVSQAVKKKQKPGDFENGMDKGGRKK